MLGHFGLEVLPEDAVPDYSETRTDLLFATAPVMHSLRTI